MLRGIYSAACGMRAQETRQSLIANNLANVATPGFKRDVGVGESFSEMVVRSGRTPVGRLGMTSAITSAYFDMSEGSVSNTDCPYDFAIEGDGFFAVETDWGIRYTRAGNFKLDADSYLVTMEGHRVLGDDGPIRVDGQLVAGSDGVLYADGREIGRLLVVMPSSSDALTKEGGGLFAARGEVIPAGTGEVRVIQGALELSNVSVVREMVDMIAGYRVYEAAQRALLSHDACLDRAINEVGRVG
ncbi:MAG TPA: flagellar basal-body rod protein FlgF [Bacillota bacterium]|nr:flagellar basal-body rod protein FlgF [Bacillota bacterium]HOK70126.1 flagellar basal-body rod protein FlgF [Bacillota bacterium]HOL52465.1 flagellar basal-body rod protein FlgF [Bacillota bacterium]HPQ03142.1 flagellar basal-body rod protein FlgF [Bacillota bacterium]